MVIVMAGALSVSFWTLQQHDRINESLIQKTAATLNRLNEQIDISDIRVANNKLNLTVANTGGAASKLVTIYVVNETAKQQYRYDLNFTVDGRESVSGIGQSSPAIIIKNNTDYSVKVISESGQSATTRMMSLSSVALPMSLYVIPPTVVPGSNVTVLYAVTNNLTDAHLAREIDLKLYYNLGCTSGPTCKLDKYEAPLSNTTTLGKGNTLLFKWVFKVTAPDKTYITFNATLANAKQGNYVREQAFAKNIDSSQFSSTTTIYSALLQKPELFLVLPGPFGENSTPGLYGIVVSNPTSVNMTVSRVVVSGLTAGTTGGGASQIFPSPCTFQAIYPSTAAEWNCPHIGVFQWKDVASPEVVPPLSSKSFLFRVTPGNADEEPAFTIMVAVFTNMGEFTKAGYSASMSATDNAMVNMFLSSTSNPSTAYQNTNIVTHRNGITEGSTVKFNVTVVDYDTSNVNYLKSGTRVVVNVPAGFTDIVITGSSGFTAPTILPFSDGSNQINADLSENIGDVSGSAEAKVLSFTATAPSLSETKIYVMYALIDGETSPNNVSGSALAELPLQVIPIP
jgi:hypothetical protein